MKFRISQVLTEPNYDFKSYDVNRMSYVVERFIVDRLKSFLGIKYWHRQKNDWTGCRLEFKTIKNAEEYINCFKSYRTTYKIIKEITV